MIHVGEISQKQGFRQLVICAGNLSKYASRAFLKKITHIALHLCQIIGVKKK